MPELDDKDLRAEVKIRGVTLSVHEALHRSLAHTGYHGERLDRPSGVSPCMSIAALR